MIPSFSHENLPVEITKNDTLILLEDFFYIDKNGKKHEVEKGFEFDGASIHKFFWRIITHPFSSKIVRSACLHDKGYRSGRLPKEETDDLFKETMEVEDRLSNWKQYSVYKAVDCCGEEAWDKHRKGLPCTK